MTLLGKKITLKGISQKGKNRVREHGETWAVLAETDRIVFSPSKAGPWLFIAPPGKDMHDKASRWVHATADPDFSIKEMIL